MAYSTRGLLDDVLHRIALMIWRRRANRAGDTDLGRLRQERYQARQIQNELSRMIHTAESRLALPSIGSQAFKKPYDADWAWRPELWRGPLSQPGLASVENKAMLGGEVTLFHDCEQSELSLRQLRNTREQDLAPFGLRMDVFRFDGSFLSLVVDLPQEACSGLKQKHLLRVDLIVELEKPLEIFARLNIKHGPNTEQIVRELPIGQGQCSVEFDLAYSRINEKRVESMWLDLIFEGPQMNQMVLRDLTFSRRPRAEI